MRNALLFSVLVTLLLLGCTTTEFRQFEAAQNSYIGKGGTKEIVDGVELWENGDPPRRYKVLGIINDDRGGIIPLMQRKGDIAKKAKEAGGDAVVYLGGQTQITGYQTVGGANAYSYGPSTTAGGYSTTIAHSRQQTQYAVIKYIE